MCLSCHGAAVSPFPHVAPAAEVHTVDCLRVPMLLLQQMLLLLQMLQ